MKFNSKNTNLIISDAVAYFTFPVLEKYEFIKHAFSTRIGGISKGRFCSMNLSFKQGDDPLNVIQNYHLICNAVGFGFNSIIASAQDHGDNIRIVTQQDRGDGITRAQNNISADGLLTNCLGVTLATYHADCTPIYFLDPVKKVIGLVHSGWRGTAKKIAAKMVRKMKESFGVMAQDIICVIGPSIGEECYEVDSAVYQAFLPLGGGVNIPDFFKKTVNSKYLLNIKEANRQILISAGVNPTNIEVSDVCTNCNNGLMFSHRAMGNERGTMAALFALSE